MLAVVKFTGVVDTSILSMVSTAPLLLSPEVFDLSSFHEPEIYSATRISCKPFSAIRGDRSLIGSQPIITFAFDAVFVDTLQYSVLLAAINGGVNDVEVGFGVKYSTVHGKVLPAPDLRVKSCPFMAPF